MEFPTHGGQLRLLKVDSKVSFSKFTNTARLEQVVPCSCTRSYTAITLASDNERQIAAQRTESLIKSLFLVIGLLSGQKRIKNNCYPPLSRIQSHSGASVTSLEEIEEGNKNHPLENQAWALGWIR